MEKDEYLMWLVTKQDSGRYTNLLPVSRKDAMEAFHGKTNEECHVIMAENDWGWYPKLANGRKLMDLLNELR